MSLAHAVANSANLFCRRELFRAGKVDRARRGPTIAQHRPPGIQMIERQGTHADDKVVAGPGNLSARGTPAGKFLPMARETARDPWETGTLSPGREGDLPQAFLSVR